MDKLRGGNVRTQQEDSLVQAKERVSEENNAANTLISNFFLVYRIVTN